MQIETTATQYIIRLNRTAFSVDDINRLLRNLRLKELASQLGGTPDEANQLADDLMEHWWSNEQSEA